MQKINELSALLQSNSYPGRGIIAGLSEDGKYAVCAYFIMGRSANSRNRVFTAEDGCVTIYPFDASKVEDPSLIIYRPVVEISGGLVVTNGDQTETVVEFMEMGKSFERALETRCFEPDAPNYTPRISCLMLTEGEYSYKLSILKSADEQGSGCNRFTFNYAPVKGLGHFIHTYDGDGNPIPSFSGEPERVAVKGDIDAFTAEIWENLNADNKISLYTRYVNLESGEYEYRLINKNV